MARSDDGASVTDYVAAPCTDHDDLQG